MSSKRHDQADEKFWHNYLSILENYSSDPVMARAWYRQLIEDYIMVCHGVKLQQDSPHNMDISKCKKKNTRLVEINDSTDFYRLTQLITKH